MLFTYLLNNQSWKTTFFFLCPAILLSLFLPKLFFFVWEQKILPEDMQASKNICTHAGENWLYTNEVHMELICQQILSQIEFCPFIVFLKGFLGDAEKVFW